MQKADLTTRAVAGFIDLLIVTALNRLPDVIGFLSATGFILLRDGLFDGQSPGKRLVGLRVAMANGSGRGAGYRESIIRNIPFAIAYMLFIIPFAGWVLGPLALGLECLAAMGDGNGMRIGDLLAGTCATRQAASAATKTMPENRSDQPSADEAGQDFEI